MASKRVLATESCSETIGKHGTMSTQLSRKSSPRHAQIKGQYPYDLRQALWDGNLRNNVRVQAKPRS
jgi:hypothetical protein